MRRVAARGPHTGSVGRATVRPSHDACRARAVPGTRRHREDWRGDAAAERARRGVVPPAVPALLLRPPGHRPGDGASPPRPSPPSSRSSSSPRRCCRPDNHASIADAIVRKFALTGDSAKAVQTVFAPSGEASIGVLSVLLLLMSGISLSRRIQRMYLEAWQLPRAPGVRASLYAAVALGALILELGLLSFIRTLLREIPYDWAAGFTGSLLSSIVVWTSIPWLLLNRRVAWQRLLPAGILAGVLSTLWGYATTIYMPRLMTSYSERYGLFGVTIALVGLAAVHRVHHRRLHGRRRRARPGAGVVGDPTALPVDRVPAAARPGARRAVASVRAPPPAAPPPRTTRDPPRPARRPVPGLGLRRSSGSGGAANLDSSHVPPARTAQPHPRADDADRHPGERGDGRDHLPLARPGARGLGPRHRGLRGGRAAHRPHAAHHRRPDADARGQPRQPGLADRRRRPAPW